MTAGITVYAGLSLDAVTARRALPTAGIADPIRRGDLYRDYERGTRCFLVIDGEFDQSWAVSAGEILDVLRAGAVVFGSSSIGALRAAEVAPYGMVGVGRIFELVRASPVFMDDWLGHLFDPFTMRPATLPFVEVLFALERDLPGPLVTIGPTLARRFDVRFDALDRDACHRLVDRMRLGRGLGAKRDLDALFAGRRATQKRKDAIELVRVAARWLRELDRENARLRGRDRPGELAPSGEPVAPGQGA